MASQTKLLPLISELGKLTLNAPTLTNIDTLTPVDGSYPQQLRLVYVQQHYKESMPLKNSIYLTFDPSKTPALTSFPSFSSVENDVQADSYSPSRQFRALFRKSGDKTVLEIWSKTGLWKSLRISDLHGTIYADPIFCMGSVAIWSQDEKRIVYIAEKKDEPITKYYDGLDTDDQATKTLNKFTYKQELGEGYPGRKTPLVFIYDIEEGTLHQVLNIPKDVIATCVSFADSEGKSIIFSGFTFKEFKLGMKFCSNRPSQIFHAKKLVLEKMGKPKKPEEKKNGEGKAAEEKKEEAGEKKEGAEAKKEEVDEKKQREQEAEQNMAVKLNDDPISTCPAINSDFSKVIYYFSPWKHTHAMSFGLKILNLKEGAEKKEELIVDIVQEKRKADEFPGITGFTDILVKTSWIGDDYVVFNTYRGCSLGIFLLNVKTKEIRRLDQGKYKSDEWRIRAVFGDTIVSTVSNPDGASKFGIYHGLNLKGANLAEVVKDAKWHYYDLQFKGLDGSVQNKFDDKGEIEERIIDIDGVESLFFAAKEAKDSEGKVIPYNKRPMMVFLHGGPHGVYTGAFTVMRHYLQAHGYNVLYPCFTGSMGYGQKFLEDLAGKIGEIDIKEILQVVQHCVKEGLCDGNSVGILGGSYGGFLCGVLLAKHSEMFKCAVIINPAINVLHLWETSDIPEWGPSEVLNKSTVFDINADEIKKMYDMSPISMYKGVDVKSSILLVVGEKDRRVPWGGAFQYYKMLKTKGADVRMVNYPEGDHSLIGNPEVEFDLLIQTVKFVNEKLGKEKAEDKPQA